MLVFSPLWSHMLSHTRTLIFQMFACLFPWSDFVLFLVHLAGESMRFLDHAKIVMFF